MMRINGILAGTMGLFLIVIGIGTYFSMNEDRVTYNAGTEKQQDCIVEWLKDDANRSTLKTWLRDELKISDAQEPLAESLWVFSAPQEQLNNAISDLHIPCEPSGRRD